MAKSIFDQFGISEMPWIMRVYVLLYLSAICLILLPGLNIFNFQPETMSEIISIGKDSLKIITGAVIGSLSIAAQKEWSKPKSETKETAKEDSEKEHPTGG